MERKLQVTLVFVEKKIMEMLTCHPEFGLLKSCSDRIQLLLVPSSFIEFELSRLVGGLSLASGDDCGKSGNQPRK